MPVSYTHLDVYKRQVHHGINTGDKTPIRQPPRRPPLSKQEEMSRLVQDMFTEGVLSLIHI